MAEITANGVTLYYEEYGSGDSIVGIHGAGSSAAFWTDAARVLARHGRVIVYDRRGCSRSERPEPYSTNVHEQADDAAALIDALDAAPAILIGRSYGGAIALDVALRYPDRVRAIVELEGDGGLLSEAARRELAELRALASSASEKGFDTMVERVLRRVAGDRVWEDLPEGARRIMVGNGPAMLAELNGGFPEVTRAELATVEQPTLLLGGKQSLLDYEAMMTETAAALPSARIEWVEGGHLIDPAHPVVLDFVAEVLAGTTASVGR